MVTIGWTDIPILIDTSHCCHLEEPLVGDDLAAAVAGVVHQPALLLDPDGGGVLAQPALLLQLRRGVAVGGVGVGQGVRQELGLGVLHLLLHLRNPRRHLHRHGLRGADTLPPSASVSVCWITTLLLTVM